MQNRTWTVRMLPGAAALALMACEGGASGTSDTESAVETDAGSDTDDATGGSDAGATDVSTSEAPETTDAATTSAGSTGGEPVCGDGQLDDGELCDGAEFGDQSCVSQGFVDGGELSCTDSCELDVSGCAKCQDWLQQYGTSKGESARAIVLDQGSDLFISGSTNGSFEGNPPACSSDAILSRFSIDGAVLWTRTLGTAELDRAHLIATDNAGAIYIAGTTEGAFDGFEFAGGIFDIFVAKYDTDGQQLWVQQYGTSTDDAPGGLFVDPRGDVYVTGSTAGALDGATPLGGVDVFITKLDANGSRLWTQLYGTEDHDIGFLTPAGAAMDASGHIVMAGNTRGALVEPPLGDTDAFVMKFDGEGDVLWTRQVAFPNGDTAYGASLSSEGHVFLFGGGSGPDEDLSGVDFWISKLTADGEDLWSRGYGTEHDDHLHDLVATSDGGFWLVGGSRGDIDGDNQFEGLMDAFLSRHDESGDVQWVYQLGTPGLDRLLTATVDAVDTLYSGGSFTGALPGQEHLGSTDAVVVRVCDP